jgi:hypothetical protein
LILFGATGLVPVAFFVAPLSSIFHYQLRLAMGFPETVDTSTNIALTANE